jgi:hypothetical protein
VIYIFRRSDVVRFQSEAEAGVTGHVVEEALGFSPKGNVRPIDGLPRQEGRAKRVF